MLTGPSDGLQRREQWDTSSSSQSHPLDQIRVSLSCDLIFCLILMVSKCPPRCSQLFQVSGLQSRISFEKYSEALIWEEPDRREWRLEDAVGTFESTAHNALQLLSGHFHSNLERSTGHIISYFVKCIWSTWKMGQLDVDKLRIFLLVISDRNSFEPRFCFVITIPVIFLHQGKNFIISKTYNIIIPSGSNLSQKLPFSFLHLNVLLSFFKCKTGSFWLFQ